LREIWAIRVRLQLRCDLRELALFNLAIDSKLRACDLLGLRVGHNAHENHVNSRAVVMQRKPRRPVQFEITEMNRVRSKRGPERRTARFGLCFPQPIGRLASFVHATLLSNRPSLGSRNRPRQLGLWHTLDAVDKGAADLSPNQEPSRGPAIARPQQARGTVTESPVWVRLTV
jgi:hypothetical protein